MELACTIDVIAISGTILGHGPFVMDNPHQSLLFLQAFLATVTLTALIIAAQQTEMKKLTDDLKRSNIELEQFAYIASHDLKEPLRIVSNYTDLLEQRYRDHLDKKALEYIKFAKDGTLQAQQLINDLLNFSRLNTQKSKHFQLVSMDVVLNMATSNLKILIEETGAVINSTNLPTLLINPNQIAQVFQNLLSNAIKFRREAAPVIQINAAYMDQQWIFSVRDNGIGISKDNFDKIFVIFQRLHPQAEYQGTGIGLATCKRVIEIHEGQIWVESELGKGSTFYFTLPG